MRKGIGKEVLLGAAIVAALFAYAGYSMFFSSPGVGESTVNEACTAVEETIMNANPSTDSWAQYFQGDTLQSVSCLCGEKGKYHDMVVIWRAESTGGSYTGSATMNLEGGEWRVFRNPTVWTEDGKVLEDRSAIISTFRKDLRKCGNSLPG